MTEAALEARRAYTRAWRAKNRDHLRAYQNKWRKENPEKVKQYAANHWEKKSQFLMDNEG